MSCWVNGGKCLHGFDGGILSAKMSFCADCSEFSLNREEVFEKQDNLERGKLPPGFISEEDQGEICNRGEMLQALVVEKITNLKLSISRGEVKTEKIYDIRKEMIILGLLGEIFTNL
ncbi:MAG: hypothetical protein KAV41_01390 [Candidatus Pacebacteria bacterium]|nr:hypothetical protein [Candidatus Paceibacterota bacterium]